ncbi:hypothetical protein PF007_g18940 [Phytophthora fragariae]|uniref:Secreted protein n=1 Tax=Phytophthora fragariae TaxID=53985 RepID=A0A6A3R8A4_9STRA|nr:hypothetical protein PF007_g18940 [Phytophthora fragariae]KAE9156389.1 hypothetical protein PF004_g32612 [Phytophthora fragariae]KAE9260711.1 hypothetical protein PF008_g33035 [Phytophthora fragariae]
MVLCIRSAFPLLDWLRASLRCLATPVCLQNRSTFWYSPPESVRRTWIRQLNCFSKNTKKCSNCLAAASFVRARNTLQ